MNELLRQAEALRERGAQDEARRLCEEVLEKDAESAAALNLLAALAADEGDFAAAVRAAQRALELRPRLAGAHYTLGRVHQAEGRLAQAEASYRRSLELENGSARAHNNLGCVLQMQGRIDEAVSSFRQALALEPDLPQAQQNLALITRDRAALEQAAAGYRRAAQANPADAAACNHLGNVYRELGLHREAIESFGEAIRRDPASAEAHFSRSMERLLLGEFREGWDEYEWRWKVNALGQPPRDFREPPWDGRAIDGTLLLHAEQGFGDTFQFVRYAALAARRCRTLLLECQPALAGLLRSVSGPSQIVPRGAPLPAFDAHLALMSLPRVFGTEASSIPWEGPYVKADASRMEHWRGRLDAGAKLRIGLAWAGRPQQWDDRKRSMTLASLAPLAAVSGAAFYSLQFGYAAAQAALPPAGMRLTDFGEDIREFGEMAALMACLDLVVTIDTSVAHLAGAMGLPVWVLLAYAPDWRWLLGREDSPWYPTMRLFRQQRDGDWPDVLARVAQALRAMSSPLR